MFAILDLIVCRLIDYTTNDTKAPRVYEYVHAIIFYIIS